MQWCDSQKGNEICQAKLLNCFYPPEHKLSIKKVWSQLGSINVLFDKKTCAMYNTYRINP